MEFAILLGSLMIAVGSSVLIWTIKQISKNYYKPKSTRSTYKGNKRGKHKADVPLTGLVMFLEASAGAVAFVFVMGVAVGWDSDFSWIGALMVGYVGGALVGIALIKNEVRKEMA
jgi:hypothetical protein